MPKFSEQQEELIRRSIKDAIASDPIISVRKLQDWLFASGFETAEKNPLSLNYVHKMIKKVRTEVVQNVKNDRIEKRLAQTRERYRITYQHLFRIAHWTTKIQEEFFITKPENNERIRALEAMVKMDLAILAAEMTAGIYDKPDLADDKKGLSDDKVDKIKETFANWGIIFKSKEPEIKADAKKQHPKQKELNKIRKNRKRLPAPASD